MPKIRPSMHAQLTRSRASTYFALAGSEALNTSVPWNSTSQTRERLHPRPFAAREQVDTPMSPLPAPRFSDDSAEVVARATPFFQRFQERDGLVRMKSAAEPRYAALRKGVRAQIYLRAAMVLVNYPQLGYNPTLREYSLLSRSAGGSRLLTDVRTGITTRPNDGQPYLFVTMYDASIRIAEDHDVTNAHALLAGYAPYVLAAGEVVFKNGREIFAITKSGTYMPEESSHPVAGLSCPFFPVSHARTDHGHQDAPPPFALASTSSIRYAVQHSAR